MCGFLSKDHTHVTGVYLPHEHQQQASYDPVTYSPSHSPHRRPLNHNPPSSSSSPPPPPPPPHHHHYHHHHRHPGSPRRYTPPQEHTKPDHIPFSQRFRAQSENENLEPAFPQEPSPAFENSQDQNEVDSHQARRNMIRVPCSVITQTNSSTDTSDPHSFPKRRSEDTEQLSEALKCIVELKEFLASAPTQFGPGEFIRQFRLPSEEQISCVRWRRVFCITGTDIVRSLVFRFSVFGREVTNRKKFEEGVFSDLRNLKINVDATLESPKSELLELLYKHHCVRTKKKQKVFFWYSVQHDQLFIDTLERELKREQAYKAEQEARSQGANDSDDSYMFSGSPASTRAVREPALSFKFNSAIPLIEQVSSISKGLPPNFATLLDATTTSLNVPEETSTFVSPTNVTQIVSHSTGRPSNAHNSNLQEYEYSHPQYPLTPTQSLEKVNSHDIRYSPRFYGRQQSTFATPESLVSMRTPTSMTHTGASTSPSWSQSSNLDSQSSLSMDASVADTSTSIPRRSNLKREIEESDFPLELLAQHDYEHQKPQEHASFYNKYHDFVYNNRPALSTASSMLAPSPFSLTDPGVAFAGSDWGRGGGMSAESSQLTEDFSTLSYQQHFPPMWKRPSNHQQASLLDPPFENNQPTETCDIGRGRSGRVTKYTSVSGGSFTDSY